MTNEEKVWDLYSKGIPEQGYSIEDDMEPFIGQDVMLKEDFIKAIEEYLKLEGWKVEIVDRYYYASGRNYWAYKEVTYWYNTHSLQRKETVRQADIVTGGEWGLPEWAKGIIVRNKSLESII